MEDRQEDADADEGIILVDEPGDAEQATTSQSVPSGSGPSKTTRTGSPVPPKILYKSTTGKGVAFTQEDVQYLMDYMKYRKYVASRFPTLEERTRARADTAILGPNQNNWIWLNSGMIYPRG